jgi:RNA polymerase sigma factor (sigma-70 family)
MTPRRPIEPARLAGTTLLHTQSDERLVDLTRAGNGRAFEAIVTRYRRQLLRYCSGILPPERAEDAVQQAFLNAYKGIVAGEAELKLRPWLYRIAHNSALNLLRQNGWSYDQIPEDFDGVVQPPQAVEQSERIRQMVRSVQELPERQRDAIVLRELEGRSYEEIAAALGVSDGAVRQLLNRARTTLRAAATSITPPQLVQRIAEQAGADAPAAARIAEVSTAGAGGAMTLAKLGTAVLVAGAVAGGVTGAPLHHSDRGRGADVAEAAEEQPGLGGPGGDDGGLFDTDGGGRSGPGSGGGGGHSGPGSGGGGGHSGPGGGGGEHSGPGSGGEDQSGSGSSGDGDGGSSGGGSSGSGSSGSGDGDGSSSGSGSDGGDSSGSGSSGSGSGDSGSGSGDSGSGSSFDSSGSGSGGLDDLSSGSSGSGSGTSGPG